MPVLSSVLDSFFCVRFMPVVTRELEKRQTKKKNRKQTEGETFTQEEGNN